MSCHYLLFETLTVTCKSFYCNNEEEPFMRSYRDRRNGSKENDLGEMNTWCTLGDREKIRVGSS